MHHCLAFSDAHLHAFGFGGCTDFAAEFSEVLGDSRRVLEGGEENRLRAREERRKILKGGEHLLLRIKFEIFAYIVSI